MRRALPIAILLLVGCARSEDASVTVDMNRIAPDIVLRNNAEEEIAVGTWREASQENSPALEFTDASGQPGVSMRCAERGGLMLQRHGAVQAGANPSISISVGRERRDVPAQLIEGGLLRATLTSGDPLITALGGAATPIGVRAVGAAPLLLPPGPPLSAFVARCAASQGAPAAGGASAGNAATPATNASAPAPAPATNGAAAR
jgi:hypothetical protein